MTTGRLYSLSQLGSVQPHRFAEAGLAMRRLAARLAAGAEEVTASRGRLARAWSGEAAALKADPALKRQLLGGL